MIWSARVAVAILWSAAVTMVCAQPKSAIEFYDTTGTAPVARFGWQGQATGGKYYLDVPPGTEALRVQNRNLTVNGDISATAFHGDGSQLTGVSATTHTHTNITSASIVDGSVQTADLQDSAVTSAKIRDGSIANVDISEDAAISCQKLDGDFGSRHLQFHRAGTAVAREVHVGTTYLAPPANVETFEIVVQEAGRPPHYILSSNLGTHQTGMRGTVSVDTLDARVTLRDLSDRRLKRDVLPLGNCLQKVDALVGVSYEYCDADSMHAWLPGGRQIGLIAQDVEKAVPEVVALDGDGYRRVDYAKLVPVLINAIKEQQEVLERQDERLAQQQVELDVIKRSLGK